MPTSAVTLWQAGGLRTQQITVRCDWRGHVHMPLWFGPAVVALVSIGFLLACFRKRQDLVLVEQPQPKAKAKVARPCGEAVSDC